MKTPEHIAKHFREIHFGGNWTCSNLRDQLSDISFQEAMTKVGSLNTIAALAFHINYYVGVILKVLQGGPLDAHDKFSYDHPDFANEQEWEAFLQKMWNDAELLIPLIEQIPDEQLNDYFTDQKYGTYYRNFHGMIEHSHYHLGQIAVIKKMIRENQHQR